MVTESFAGMMIEGSLRDRLGPAIAAGQTILLYGPTGNGKTTIAERVGECSRISSIFRMRCLSGGKS